MQDAPNYYDFAIGKQSAAKADSVLPKKTVVLDQDTVIGDAMCEAAQLVYEVALEVARHIAENAQYAIDIEKIKEAELAWAFMDGSDFGLAVDEEVCEWLLLEMQKCIVSIRKSKDTGFQEQIFVPHNPARVLGFDENKARRCTFLSCFTKIPPSQEMLAEAYEKLPEYVKKKVEAADAAQVKDMPISEEVEVEASDEVPAVTSLRNQMRLGRIDASQYLGGLGALLAAGVITKAQLASLKNIA